MTVYVAKLLISAALIVAVSEVAKRSSAAGGLLASLPLVSLLGIIWLYRDTGDAGKVAALSWSIFWMVLPSLSLFVVLPVMLRHGASFVASLCVGVGVMLLLYAATAAVLQRLS